MKKMMGIGVILAGSVISAVDLVRMLQGRAYGWDSILGGFAIAFLSWIFLMESGHGPLWNAAKATGGVAAVAALALVLSGNGISSPGQSDTAFNHQQNSGYSIDNNDYYDHHDDSHYSGYHSYDWQEADDPITCWTCYGDGICNNCNGSGKYDYGPSVVIGDRCRMCEGNGRCPGCDGRGVYN